MTTIKNTIKDNDRKYKFEFLFADQDDVPVEKTTEWNNKDVFLPQLKNIEHRLKLKHYPKSKKCLICGKTITTGYYSLGGIRWEDGLKHYVNKHNLQPSDEYVDFIFKIYNSDKNQSRIIHKFPGISIIKSNKKFLKIDRNQILIMDALMQHGGKKIYKDKKNKNIYKYSEHSGLLDFNNNGLEKIIISGNTNRIDAHDDDIFLPKNMIEAFDYEYIFHTHPPTPYPGARAISGLLYEFPSISDIFHFIDHYNQGITQGSIVMTPEGMYVILKKNFNDAKIDIDEDTFYDETLKIMMKCQTDAIKKYGTQFNEQTFYSKISQDTSYIDRINKVINNYKLNINFYPRILDESGEWVIDTVYLPVYTQDVVANTRR